MRRMCFLAVLMVLGSMASAMAAGPAWMPGFPMRMGASVMLMWAPQPGATAYNIYKSGKDGDLGTLLTSGPMNNFMDPSAPTNKTVIYVVKALVGGKEGDPSAPGKLLGVDPLEPPKITGKLFSEGQLNLRWDNVKNAAFYNVYKSLSAEGPFELASSVQEIKYVDAKVEVGKTYFYQISAVDRLNTESPKSAVDSITIEKPKEVVKAKTYALKSVLMKSVGYWYGSEAIPLKNPNNAVVAPSGDVIYVCNPIGISSLDMEGQTIKLYGPPPNYASKWGQPMYLTMGADGLLWASWKGSEFNIRALDPATGAVVKEFNVTAPKELYDAAGRTADWEKDKAGDPLLTGLALDQLGRLWALDQYFGVVSVLDTQGTLVKRIGTPRLRTSEIEAMKGLYTIAFNKTTNRMYAVDNVQGVVRIFDSTAMDFVERDGTPYFGTTVSGSGPGYVVLPMGISISKEGSVVLVDGGGKKVQAYDGDMNYLHNYVTKEGVVSIDELASPTMLVIEDNFIIVSEIAENRLSIFSLE